MPRCSRCNKEIAPEEVLTRGAEQLCEDCLMDALSPAKACDPWAVKMAKGSVPTSADAVAALQGLEKKIYELVCGKGKVPKADVPPLVGATPKEVERAFAVLRHMELLRGEKAPDGTIYCTRFSSP